MMSKKIFIFVAALIVAVGFIPIRKALGGNLYAQYYDEDISNGAWVSMGSEYITGSGQVKYVQVELNIANDGQFGPSYYCPVAPNTGVLVFIFGSGGNFVYVHCVTSEEAAGKLGRKALYTFSDANFGYGGPINYMSLHFISPDAVHGIAKNGSFFPYLVLADAGGPGSPATIDSLAQYSTNEMSVIPENGAVSGNDLVLTGIPRSFFTSHDMLFQVEVGLSDTPFTGLITAESEIVLSGSVASVTVSGLAPGKYHWRGRGIDLATGDVSAWLEFRNPENVDFTVEAPLPISLMAANLAKQLVLAPYLFGGKGWDYENSLFVDASDIRTGYKYWNQAINNLSYGAGVDCSGLVMWAYNRSFAPDKPRIRNYVTVEGADQQFRYNTATTTESELEPGDTLFFDYIDRSGNPGHDGHMDHVAMYVGGGSGYDVVSAAGPLKGIIGTYKSILEQSPSFVAFKRIIQGPSPYILVTAHSPVDISVTDPDGFLITPTTTLVSDEEYLREIPGVLYYSASERGSDGNPITQVYSFAKKLGDYVIKATPIQGASPSSTYSLDLLLNNEMTELARDIPIGSLPVEGYGLNIAPDLITHQFIPVSIDIKSGNGGKAVRLNSGGTISVIVLGSATFNVGDINTSSITVGGAPLKLKGKGSQEIDYKDWNSDGNIDLIVRVPTRSLQITSDQDARIQFSGLLNDGREVRGTSFTRLSQ